MDKSWIHKPRLSEEYIAGVKDFLEFAFAKIDATMLKCPCCRCSLVKYKYKDDIYGDLMYYGFLPTYTNWHFHGERLNTIENSVLVEPGETSNLNEDSTMELLDDVFPNLGRNFDDGAGSSNQPLHQEESTDPSPNSDEKSAFDELLADAREELYEGCTSFSKLSFMLKLYHIKCFTRISDKGISMIIDLLREAFEHAKLPASLHDLKKTIRKLGLHHESIHACPNHCMLFWGEDAERDVCKICQTSRWKSKKGEEENMHVEEEGAKKKKKKKRQAAKVLRYFPLKPRLQRLFLSSKTAESMKWHATEENQDGKLRHPRDGQAWKTFDQQFSSFASDARNVRLGLATDGFNPYGAMSTNYSIWPVLLFPYNLPPWMAMKQSSMILSMIIPGKKMPGNDIDVYLQPLIKELKELWADGVQTFDASTKQTFCMRAALMWTISDFPGLGNLSGWNTYTGLACPSCNYDAAEVRLQHGKKNCFMGHRRFLQHDHNFRFDKQHFDGKEELRNPPQTPAGSVIFQQQENVDIIFGKGVETSKRNKDRVGREEGTQWRKKSIFFELPYWKHVLLRHNLDVMHIEKNVFDNVVFTLLDDKKRSKDNLNARKDLFELGIRSELWPEENGKYPPASFKLTAKEKDIFLGILHSARLPDGYSSNLSNCIDVKQQKIHGLKSHDCHVIMGHLLPIAIRNVLSVNVTSVITELCYFFRDICSKVIDTSELLDLQRKIVLTLFHFDASNENYKKFVMKSLSQKCKGLKTRLWRQYRRNTPEETIEARPNFIPKEQWQDFVHLQFTEKTKKLSEQNTKSRSHYKTPHTLGKKSIARKSKEILIKTGKRPSRGDIFVCTRKKANGNYVNEEARDLSEKLTEKMTQSMENTSENTTSNINDEFAQVFGAERPGRVRCVGLGPTPSTFFQNRTTPTSSEAEVRSLRNQVQDLEDKLEKMNDLLNQLVSSNYN